MLRYRLKGIHTEYFRLNTECAASQHYISYPHFFFMGSAEKKQILAQVQFKIESQEEELVDFKVSSLYEIASEDFDNLVTEDCITLPKPFVISVMSQMTALARGILHSKVEGTPYSGILIPIINVSNAISGDSIKLSKEGIE